MTARGGAGRTGDSSVADGLVAAFTRWAGDRRAGEAAESRSRERWLRQQAAETATMVGTLVDLAEQRADVAMVVGSRTISGRLIGVGRDACVVAEPSGAATVIALSRLGAVRVAGRRPGTGEATGERETGDRWRLVDALTALAAERSPVRLGLQDGETLGGVLVAVGEDVATLHLATGGMRAHVAMAALETVTPI